MDRLFFRGWVFIGHESEIPLPGDFVTRPIGTQPVIMARAMDGQVSVMVNRCAHRGTMVCSEARGNTRTFACPYHGWTYDRRASCSACRTRGPMTADSTRRRRAWAAPRARAAI